VLNGILAVVGTELSWRDIPKKYGKRDRAYKRYRLWQDQGLLPRIIAALADSTAEMSL
jgi:transposase